MDNRIKLDFTSKRNTFSNAGLECLRSDKREFVREEKNVFYCGPDGDDIEHIATSYHSYTVDQNTRKAYNGASEHAGEEA